MIAMVLPLKKDSCERARPGESHKKLETRKIADSPRTALYRLGRMAVLLLVTEMIGTRGPKPISEIFLVNNDPRLAPFEA
jgi:hypothetical protein